MERRRARSGSSQHPADPCYGPMHLSIARYTCCRLLAILACRIFGRSNWTNVACWMFQYVGVSTPSLLLGCQAAHWSINASTENSTYLALIHRLAVACAVACAIRSACDIALLSLRHCCSSNHSAGPAFVLLRACASQASSSHQLQPCYATTGISSSAGSINKDDITLSTPCPTQQRNGTMHDKHGIVATTDDW